MHLIDLHCDTISRLQQIERKDMEQPARYESLTNNTGMLDIEGMKKAGTMAQFFAHFIYMDWYDYNWDYGYEGALHMIARGKQEIADTHSDIQLVTSYKQLMKLQQAKNPKIGAFLTIEEGGILNNQMERLHFLYNEGIRLMTLTWNYENCLGYPNHDDPKLMKKGLKQFGIEVVEEMNHLGMLVDVSHLSDGGFWDVLTHSTKPILASHSNARALCPIRRNLSDEMLQALGDRGGVAGVNFYPNFISTAGNCTADEIASHVQHMIQVGGEDLPAVGTDFDGYDYGTSNINHVRDMELFYDALERANLSAVQIEKVCCKNALRIIKDTL